MKFIVLKVETVELGNELIETIECVGIFRSFEAALAACTQCLAQGHDVMLEQEAA